MKARENKSASSDGVNTTAPMYPGYTRPWVGDPPAGQAPWVGDPPPGLQPYVGEDLDDGADFRTDVRRGRSRVLHYSGARWRLRRRR